MRTVLCLTHFYKGHRLLESFKQLGCHTLLVGTARVRHHDWSPDYVDERFFLHDFEDQTHLLNSISYLARDRQIDLVVPLEEYSVDVAGKVRAHLGCPGLSEGVTRCSRDKLAMRLTARKAGLPVPAFEPFLNRARIADFLKNVPAPWMLKPRMEGGAKSIRKLHQAKDVWSIYDELGDRRSHHLIEAFVPAQVYHVDSIVQDKKVLLAVAGHYGTPPFDVWNGGGVFSSRTVPKRDPLHDRLLELNKRVIASIGIERGVNHAEFLVSGDEIFFLEIGARVAGSNLDRLTTGATGIDLFLESARLELEWLNPGSYQLPKFVRREAAIALCLSRQSNPTQSFCQDFKEVVWTLNQDHHAGCVVASKSTDRIDDIISIIGENLQRDHLAVLPNPPSPG